MINLALLLTRFSLLVDFYAPYPLLIRPLTFINRCLRCLCLVLCCFATSERQGMFCVFAAINHSPPVSLSFLLFYHIKLFVCFLSFFCFNLLVTPLLIYIYILQQHIGKLEERGRGSNENRTAFT